MRTNERILLFIADYRDKYFIPPSTREICKGVELKSTSTVHGHLNRLRKNGYIKSNVGSPRSIVITETGMRYVENIRKRG